MKAHTLLTISGLENFERRIGEMTEAVDKLTSAINQLMGVLGFAPSIELDLGGDVERFISSLNEDVRFSAR